MSYLYGIRDFVFELLSPKTTLNFKKMRILARIPMFRSRYTVNVHYNPNDTVSNEANKWLALQRDAESILKKLQTCGYAEGINLSSEALNGLIAFCNSNEFTSDRGTEFKVPISFSDSSAPGSSSIYSLMNPHLESKIVEQLIYSSPLRTLAERYLNAEPTLMNSQIWYTFPKDGLQAHHNFGFHYDIDDYRFLKFFFYLDEVDDGAGPHVIISGTHNEGSVFKFFNRRISDCAAFKRYPGKVITMKGCAGAGFAEDTFCYHKGQHPSRRRVILQIQFGISKIGII
jgi:hypothetical protein